MFCDELKVKLIAGKGGNGASTFRREKFVPRGGPDGGDGGTGGDIIFRVNPHLNTLSTLAHKKVHKGNDGVNGQKKNMHGKNAEPLFIDVPRGTMIFNEDKTQLIADLTETEQIAVIAKGGRKGLGNVRFASATHNAPTFAETGEPGQEVDVVLELKMVAEVGLIGLPSAGKSTLISVISNAKPKIAAYHFTTLVPNLGVVDMKKFGGSSESSFLVADIPGLIEGASEGKGLGHQFLKHITRTKLLVHIIDGTLENIVEDYKTINTELTEFAPELKDKQQIIVINKIDLLDEEALKEKTKELQKILGKNTKVFKISGIARLGLKELMFEVQEKLEKIRKIELEEADELKEIEETSIPVIKPHEDKIQFEIDKIINKKEYKIFRITGKRIEQVVVMTDINHPEGLERIYHYLHKMGIQKAIERKGATFGDKIKINEKLFSYRK